MYSFTGRIRFSEVDETGRLSIPAIVDLLQDCSTFQSESLGVGPAHARECGKAWMLSAWQIEVVGRPAFASQIRVSTWATAFKGVRASRDFTICDVDDATAAHPFVRATSSWFLFDSNVGRPIRLPEEEVAPYLPDIEGDEPLGMPRIPRRISVEGEGVAAAPVTVTGAHLDTNHHVNNAQYVSLALGALDELGFSGAYAEAPGAAAPGVDPDAAPASDERPSSLWIDVHYTAAAKLGDVICPHVHAADGATTVSLDGADGKPYAEVRLRREPREA